MIAKRITEEQMYSRILDLYSKNDVDYTEISKIIFNLYSMNDIESENISFDVYARNILLLIIGLLRKDKAIEERGIDIKFLPETTTRKIIRDLKAIFMEDAE